ncbi:MAG: hypothetical protein V1777_00880 [Candidatus Micrarchaeota archaeon]
MPKKKFAFSPVVIGMIVIIALLVVVIGVLVFQNPASPNPNPQNSQQPLTPSKATLQIISILPSSCPKCVSIASLVSQIKTLDMTFTEKTLTLGIDAKAQELVTQYSIGKLPALVLIPDANALDQLRTPWQSFGTVEDDNAMVLREIPLPYLNVVSQKTIGLVKLTTIEPANCPDCATQLTSDLLNQTGMSGINQGQGVFVDDDSTVLASSADGQRLITQYAITKLPAVLLSPEVADYSDFFSLLEQKKLGSTETDGTWVLRNPVPLYFDLNQNKVRGQIELTQLSDVNCATCFDVNELANSMINFFGLKLIRNQTLDISSVNGNALVKKYSILRVPTIVIGGDVSAYQGLAENWNLRGFATPDGHLVFDRQDLLPTTLNYFDLNSNSVKAGEAQPQASGQPAGG